MAKQTPKQIRNAGRTQKTLPSNWKDKQDAQQPKQSSIVETDSWINVKGKAAYVNIDVEGETISFITSVSQLERLVNGEIGGLRLGKFADSDKDEDE